MKLLNSHNQKKLKPKSAMGRGGTVIIECSEKKYFFARVGSITSRGQHPSTADSQRFESLRVFIILEDKYPRIYE